MLVQQVTAAALSIRCGICYVLDDLSWASSGVCIGKVIVDGLGAVRGQSGNNAEVC